MGRVVAIAGKMRDIKGDARLEEMVEGEKKYWYYVEGNYDSCR